MWGELFRDGTTLEIAQILLLVAAMGLCLMTPLIWICGKTVALREKPERRALLTVAVAYSGVALLFIFGGGDFISPWLGPFVPMPGAVLIYFWLRSTYRKGWIDDDKIPEGVKLENSDWRIGMGVVLVAILAAAIKVALKSAAIS